MAERFDAAALARLAAEREVSVRTARHPGRAVVIWVVVVGETVFARSVRGRRGQWLRDLLAEDAATLEWQGGSHAVRAVPVTDAAAIAAVSQAYLAKYADSPYAAAMVRADVLDTTLRLDAV